MRTVGQAGHLRAFGSAVPGGKLPPSGCPSSTPQGREITLESDYAEDLRRALDVLRAEG